MDNNTFWYIFWTTICLLIVIVVFLVLYFENLEKRRGHELALKREETPDGTITIGDRDEDGFCDTFRDGEKTNVRMLVFTKEQVEKINKAIDKIEGNES
jgi:hypothetical protein